MKINRELIPLKGHYFFFNAATAPLYPTMPVYAKQIGMNSVVVGTIYTIFPICGVLAKPVIGAIGDAWKAHKTLLLIVEILIMASYFSIQFVPGMPQASQEPPLNITCQQQESYFRVCPRGARQRGMVTHMVSNNLTSECILSCLFKTPQPRHTRSATIGRYNEEDYVSPPPGIDSFHSKDDPLAPVNSTKNKHKKVSSGVHRHKSHIRKFHDLNDIKPDRHRSRFTAVTPLSHAYMEGQCLVVPVKHDPEEVSCADGSVVSCVGTCSLRPLQRLLQEAATHDVEVTTYWQFWVFFVLLFISWVSTTVSVSLTDTVCVEILGKQSRQFGNQRLFGSAGWGLLAILAGFIIDAFSDGSDIKNYTPAFYLMLGPMLLDIASTYFLKYEQTTFKSRNIFKDVGNLFLNPRIIVFMIWCTFIGVCFGMIWNFLFWYMEELADVQGGEAQAYIKTIEGLVGGIQCFLGEVPSYFFSGWVLQRIGHGHSMSLVLFMAALRFLLYSVISDPWWVLPVSVLQCMNGLFFPTMTSYAKIVAEPGTEATVQGLVSALCEGVGVALGSFLGGILVNQYGGAMTFRIFGIAALIMAVFNVIAQFLLGRTSSKTEGIEAQNEKTKFVLST